MLVIIVFNFTKTSITKIFELITLRNHRVNRDIFQANATFQRTFSLRRNGNFETLPRLDERIQLENEGGFFAFDLLR